MLASDSGMTPSRRGRRRQKAEDRLPQPDADNATAPASMLLDGYLTTEELAAELDLAPLTLIRWRALKTGPPVTWIGCRLFYRRAAVQKWLLAQEQHVEA